eukprot:366109-Chlamydomonas_euryale.AAC.1
MSVEPLRSALWKEHAIGLLLPPGSPTPRLAPTEAAEAAADAAAAGRSSGGDGIEPEVLPANPADPEAADSAIHELAGSSPFSGGCCMHRICGTHATSNATATATARGTSLHRYRTRYARPACNARSNTP